MIVKNLSTQGAVNNLYSKFYKTWVKMRDSFQGEEHMKNRSLSQNSGNLEGVAELKALTTFDQYLRPTDSMRRLGAIGLQRFCDYIYRAKFYPFPLEIQTQSLGLIENEPASFELPTQMKGMLEDATTSNESLLKVLSVVNTQQLQVSRIGLLLEPSLEATSPFNIALYSAESIVDWNEIVKENSETSFDWIKLKTDECDENQKPVYLILAVVDGLYVQYKTTTENIKYGDLVGEDEGYIADSLVAPATAETTLDEIPFVITNVTRLGGAIERPFLESVTDGALSLFRASAHLEDALYWGGESTLFTRGYGLDPEKPEIYVGNGAKNISSAEYAEANYVTMGIEGIEPRQNNHANLFEYCTALGVDLINKGTESGTALGIRSNVKTASLKTLSLTGALGLQVLLRIGAKWLSLNPEEVIVTANTKFADVQYTAEDFAKFSSMVQLGAMRQQDLYNLQKKQNLTNAETFEDWKGELETPDVEVPPTVTGAIA